MRLWLEIRTGSYGEAWYHINKPRIIRINSMVVFMVQLLMKLTLAVMLACISNGVILILTFLYLMTYRKFLMEVVIQLPGNLQSKLPKQTPSDQLYLMQN